MLTVNYLLNIHQFVIYHSTHRKENTSDFRGVVQRAHFRFRTLKFLNTFLP